MTENKRFTVFGEWHKDCVIDEIRDNTGEYVTIGRVVDLLNGNERLQTHLSQLAKSNREGVKKVQSLANENEQLKKELESFKPIIFESDGKPVTLYKKGDNGMTDTTIVKLNNRIWELEKENEQLKNELKVYRKLANCGNCQYHDYDTLFGGDEEYEVCDKGNDVTDGICKDWREL